MQIETNGRASKKLIPLPSNPAARNASYYSGCDSAISKDSDNVLDAQPFI